METSMRIYPEAQLATTTLIVPGSKQKIDISFEMVTPAMATNWLESNSERQRNLNAALVRQYKNQMKKKIWHGDTGEAIKFSKNGLIDGQHRLHAVIEYGEPVLLLVMRGINDENMTRLDLGKKRSLADIFKIHGMNVPRGMTEPMLASIVNGIYAAREYGKSARKESRSSRIDTIVKSNPSPVELFEFVNANPDIIKRLAKLEKFKLPTIAKNVSIGPSLVGWFICDVIDSERADQILMTMQECVPQTINGRACAAFKMLQHLQRCRSKKTSVNKHEYAGLWLWALDHMILDRLPSKLMVQASHLPGQGHEGSRKLVEYFSKMKDVI